MISWLLVMVQTTYGAHQAPGGDYCDNEESTYSINCDDVLEIDFD